VAIILVDGSISMWIVCTRYRNAVARKWASMLANHPVKPFVDL
jgi:hypothetical protein